MVRAATGETQEPTGPQAATASQRRVRWVTDLVRLEIALWERVDARLREQHDVSLAFFETLYFLSQAPGGALRVGDLARALRVTVGGTSKLVDRIQAAGLIVRQRDPTDRRASRVVLTSEGKSTLSAAAETYEQAIAAFADPVLDADEQRELHAYITRLLDASDTGAPA